mgnify:CR=1 FL=1
MAGRRAPKIKRAIPNSQGMFCVNCQDFCVQGRIDSGGRPFLGCDRCRFLAFGVTGGCIWAWKAMSAAFAAPAFRESIRNKAIEFQEAAISQPFGAAIAPEPAPLSESVGAETQAETGAA